MITITSSHILSEDEVRNGFKRIIFTHTTSEGKVIGPVVEHRSEEEDANEFLESSKISYENSLNQPPPDEEEQLLEMLMGFGDETIKSALQIDDSKLEVVKESYETIKNQDTKGDVIDIPVDEEVK